FFRDCLPNFGMGGGGSDGAGEESADKDTDTPTEDQTQGEKGTVSIVVKGEQCMVDGKEEALACPKACEDIKASADTASRIDVDATVGAHAIVEELKTCLKDAGFSDVTVRSE